MPKKRAIFQLLDWEEINNWADAWQEAMEKAGFSEPEESMPLQEYQQLLKEAEVSRLANLRNFAVEAEPGQYVVITRNEWTAAKRIGALPERLMSRTFESMPEGVPSKRYTTSREIIPGVREEVGGVLGMHLKGVPAQKVEISRADIEEAIRRYDEEGRDA